MIKIKKSTIGITIITIAWCAYFVGHNLTPFAWLVFMFYAVYLIIEISIYLYEKEQLRQRNIRIDKMILENRLNEFFRQEELYNRNRYNYHARFERDDHVEAPNDYNTMLKDRLRRNVLGGYDVLGIEYDDSDEVVITTYRKLMLKYHPDKLESLHLSEELMTRAKEKTQEYNKAYAKICKERNL